MAVCGEAFVRGIKERLGIRAQGRKVVTGESGFELSILAWSDSNKLNLITRIRDTIFRGGS